MVQGLLDRGQGEPAFLEAGDQPEAVTVPGVVVSRPTLPPRYLEPLGAQLQILAVFENEGEEYRIPIRVGRRAS